MEEKINIQLKTHKENKFYMRLKVSSNNLFSILFYCFYFFKDSAVFTGYDSSRGFIIDVFNQENNAVMRVIREDKCCVGWLVKLLYFNFVLY